MGGAASIPRAVARFLSRHALLLGFLFVAALVAVGPLLQPGYFWGAHDARHDVYFMFEYDRSVLEGNWFPRWGPDWAFGYGYPFWIVYAPLGVFSGELLHHFLNLGWETSVKTVLGLSLLVSGLAMYGFARTWLGRRAALVAAVAYMVFPYHLVDVYVRAAVPESVGLALLPLVLWAFRATAVRPRLWAVLAAGLSYALLMWTHNLMTAIFTPGLALYVLALLVWQAYDAEKAAGRPQFGPMLRRVVRGAWAPILGIVLGLGLSAGFFIPMALESRYVNQTQWFGDYYNPFQHFVYFNQLFNPGWGFGISQPGPDDVSAGSLSYQLGAVTFVLALIALATARGLRRLRRELWFWGAWAAVAVFLTLGLSAALWRLPLIPYAQFPWRYLMLAAAPLCLLAGALVADERIRPGPAANWLTFLLAGLLLLSSYPYLQVQMAEPTPEQGPVGYQAFMRFQRTSDEMTGVTAWVDPALRPHWSPMADEWVAGRPVNTRVDYKHVPQNRSLAVNSERMGTDFEEIWYHAEAPDQTIIFNRFWYPGWKAYVLDGSHGKIVNELPVQREHGPLARIVVPIPTGENYVLLRFEDTPLRAAARWITYGTIAVMTLLALILAGRALVSRRRNTAR